MGIVDTITPFPSSEFRSFVEAHSGEKIFRCYQCGKCTSGCPSAYAMDLGPRRIMRGIQLGLKDDIIHSTTIWLCMFCQTCSARCPQEIDIARVMETLRVLAVAEKIKPAEKDVQLFHRIFLDLIQQRGRIHELDLGARYNLLSRHFLFNARLLPTMLAKGKLPILPPRVKGAAKVRELFNRVKAKENC